MLYISPAFIAPNLLGRPWRTSLPAGQVLSRRLFCFGSRIRAQRRQT